MNTLKAHYNANKNKLSPSGERAMMKEIKRQCAVYHRGYQLEIMAQLLWYFHVNPKTKYGPKKLKSLFVDFEPILREMIDYYEMDDSDRGWLCTYKLKDELGIDLNAWLEEMENDSFAKETHAFMEPKGY
jgi:hypothetical protein